MSRAILQSTLGALVRALLLAAAAAALGLSFNAVRKVGLPLRTPTTHPFGPGTAAGPDNGGDGAIPGRPGDRSIASIPEIRPAAAAEMIGAATFLDARAVAAYDERRVLGAIHLPYERFETVFGEVMPMLPPPEAPVITYCEGGECTLSHGLARALRDGGFTDVRVLEGGFEAWEAAGLPVEEGAP